MIYHHKFKQLRYKFKKSQGERLKLFALVEFVYIALLHLLYSSKLLNRYEDVYLISKSILINHLLNCVDVDRKGVVEFIKGCNYLTHVIILFNW